MVDLDFSIDGVDVARHAAAPLLLFALRVVNRTPEVPVQNVMLRCQIRIEPTRRTYAPVEQERLSDLFGVPSRWGDTLRGLLWTHAGVQVPAFTHGCTIELPVPCSYDFNIAATKYFDGVRDGEVPLSFLFSGSIFYADAHDRLQIDQVPWTREAEFRLPVQVWHELMQHYYPNAVWLCLGRDAFERLYRFKRQHGLPGWEQAIDALIGRSSTEGGP